MEDMTDKADSQRSLGAYKLARKLKDCTVEKMTKKIKRSEKAKSPKYGEPQRL